LLNFWPSFELLKSLSEKPFQSILTDPETEQKKGAKKRAFRHPNFELYPHMTVLQNITLAPVRVRREPIADAETHARSLLESVAILEHAANYPEELSGGSSSGWPLPGP